MIVPLAHEDLRARKAPIVTATLIALCLGVFLITTSMDRGVDERVHELARQALEIDAASPGVRVCPTLSVVRHGHRTEDEPELDPAAAQAQMDGVCARIDAEIASHPYRRFGYSPAHKWPGLFTHMFVHAGWLHLIFNLWFLALTCMNLEDRWGRAVFAPFFLSAGVVAALAHGALVADASTPMVGASGAIAGAMGAFLVCFARTRIRFGYFLIKVGTFHAPAWAMLPLWLAGELFDAIRTHGAGDVAHWAHVVGFVYGAAFALALRHSGLERKLDAAVEASVTTEQDPRILRAAALVDEGKAAEGLALLDQVARADPRNTDVFIESLRAAKLLKDRAHEVTAYRALVDVYLERGHLDAAIDLFEEAITAGVARDLPRTLGLQVAAELAARSEPRRASAAYAEACHEGLVDVVACRAWIARARVALTLGKIGDARALLDDVRASPFSTVELDEAAEALQTKHQISGGVDLAQ